MDPQTILKTAGDMDRALTYEIANAQQALKDSIRRLEQRIMASMKELTTNSAGNLVGPRVNLKQAQALHKKLVVEFEELYGTGLRRASQGFNNVAAAIRDTWPDLDNAIAFTGADKDVIAALQTQAIGEFKQFGAMAQEQMATAMYDAVVAGGSYASLVATVGGILTTKGLGNYAELWASDALMNFKQQVTLNKAKAAKLTYFLYYGNIILTSRPFCIDRAGKVFSITQINSWNDLSWQGKSGPPLTYRGGYNCRHHWHPVKKAWVPNSFKPGDAFEEAGLEITRGSTIPIWGKNAKGAPVKKVANPVPINKRPPVPVVDPHSRWVPPKNASTAQVDQWVADIRKHSEVFIEETGLGPCGPVADNIVEVLRAQGKDARVMFNTYLREGAEDAFDAFPHYVAVELDEFGVITRLYDPTNVYKPGVWNIKNGMLPPEYIPPNNIVRIPRDKALDAFDNALGGQPISKLSKDQAGLRNVFTDDASSVVMTSNGTTGQVTGGLSYAIEGNTLTVRNIGQVANGGKSGALSEVLEEAASKGHKVTIDPKVLDKVDGVKPDDYLEKLGFKKGADGMYTVGPGVRDVRMASNKALQQWEGQVKFPSGIHENRDWTQVYGVNGTSRDDGLFSMAEHEWWYGKLGKPAVKKAPKAAKATKAAAEEKYGWTYTTDKKQAQKQIDAMLNEAAHDGRWPIHTTGPLEGQPYFIYDHWGGTAKMRKLNGAGGYLADLTASEINAVGAKMAELANRAERLGIPKLRVLNMRKGKDVIASMGDGVMYINPKWAKRFLTDYILDKEEYAASLRHAIKGAKEELAKYTSENAGGYRVLKKFITDREDELGLIKSGEWKGPRFGGTYSTKRNKWQPNTPKTGDWREFLPSLQRPWSTKEYYIDGASKMLNTMEHEFGHHIHQTMFMGQVDSMTDNAIMRMRPMEAVLRKAFRAHERAAGRTAYAPSTYSYQSENEWFAENYAAWRAGLKSRVSPPLYGLLEHIDDLEAGRITQEQLIGKLFKNGELWDTNPSNLTLPEARGNYM